MVTADGAAGHPTRQPYDRIIATCSVPTIPPAWLTQARPGAVIVANVSAGLNSGALVRLTVSADGTAEGHFLPQYGSFMTTRAFAEPGRDHALFAAALGQTGDQRPTVLPADAVQDHDFALLVDFLTGVTDIQWFTPSDTGRQQTWLLSPDGSWACLPDSGPGRTVDQGGPQRLWDQVEVAHGAWIDLGRPTRHRFGLTVGPTAATLWLDSPGSGHTWMLPAT